jgi:hypothetical protein
MPKPDRKPATDFEPTYERADAEYDEDGQDREHDLADPDYEVGLTWSTRKPRRLTTSLLLTPTTRKPRNWSY